MKRVKFAAAVLSVLTAVSLGACGAPAKGSSYTVGICQLVQHPALDAATKGFRDAIDEALPGQVTFDEQNAAGDSATCTTIVSGFVSSNVNLILANATPALQAATAATAEIPILGTAVTEYGTALSIDGFDGTVGGNVSGTSDLAPLDQQAAIFDELLPDAKNIGILYCSAEPNSVYQAEEVRTALEKAGKTVTVYTFADSNDVASVTQTACNDNDALYIPTDNVAASCTAAIDNVAQPAGVPIVCGEEGIMAGCGIATLSIDYYELGRTTGEMAVKILTGEAQISSMPVEYYQNPVKEYDADRCAALGITVPEGYTAYTAEE
ncbi:ABC transporter substrate-binding protein [Lachnoclostridium sp. Marseille-P6806]|uniref:ABC transporter substrate-binding protein n=1 Tax=Lachnoclostridium sp. Marseille-P6806 TaxID=2364793 RepID=UPI001030634D|nr:ABC transporter substrate-binding protein [Lachnoclostridium sp. Marseille-P6806]